MLVPGKLAFYFDHHQVVAIELSHRSGLPVLAEHGELLRQIDCLHDRSLV